MKRHLKTMDVKHTAHAFPGSPVAVNRRWAASEGPNAAARYVAGVLARRQYGRRGRCVTVRLDHIGRGEAVYEVSIGRPDAAGNAFRVSRAWLWVPDAGDDVDVNDLFD